MFVYVGASRARPLISIHHPNTIIECSCQNEPHQIRDLHHTGKRFRAPKTHRHPCNCHEQCHQPPECKPVPLQQEKPHRPEQIHQQLDSENTQTAGQCAAVELPDSSHTDSHENVKQSPHNGKHPFWWREPRFLCRFKGRHTDVGQQSADATDEQCQRHKGNFGKISFPFLHNNTS